MRIHIDEDILREAAILNNQGQSITSIALKFQLNRITLAKHLRKAGYKVYDNRRKYSLNENFFENIDSSEKAYWLGFIAADGSITKNSGNSHTLSFNLNIRDKHHLEKFIQAINGEASIIEQPGIGFGEGSIIAHLAINSNKLCHDLIKLGIVYNKSLVLKPPIIQECYYGDWIRGYFDGDGSIIPELTNGNGQISFVGTLEVLTFIRNFLTPNQTNKVFGKRNKDETNNYSLTYGGTQKIIMLLNKFYKNPCIYLDRKYQKILMFYSRFQE